MFHLSIWGGAKPTKPPRSDGTGTLAQSSTA